MRTRWLGRGTAGAVGLILVVAIGCSQQEELEADPGVSPFYPAPKAEGRGSGNTGSTGITTDPVGSGAPDIEGPLRPQDVERQLRIALRAAERGETDRAISQLDRILALEPINREALLGRAALAMDQARKATSPDERAAAMDKAGSVVRTLHRAYERPNQREMSLLAAVLYEEIRVNATQGRLDRAVAVLKEAHAAGLDAFDKIEHDEAMAKLRSWPGYRALLKGIDDANLARARSRVKDQLDKPLDFAFDFKVADLDGKPVSLDQFKGKVLVVNIWGTWCEPCRKAIPGLVQLYHRHRRRGLEVLGLDHEPNAPDAETARQYVKRFVQESSIPYHIAMGNEELFKKIPGFHAYPTTLLIDRAGKVRLLITENSEGVLGALDDAIEVLLAEPAVKATDAKGATKPPADTKQARQPPANAKAVSQPPADAKEPPPPPAKSKGPAGPP